MDSEIVRYPDPGIKILDPRFSALVLGNAAIEVIASGCRFNEGPVWFGDLRCLLWSDIPNDRMMRWDEATGAVSVFREPGTCQRQHPGPGGAACHLRDGCSVGHPYGPRRHHHCAGRQLRRQAAERPEDVSVKSDGSIWFSDNGAGIRGNYLGHKADLRNCRYRVYRLDPAHRAR